MPRVIQISDTHLSPTKRHFMANWAPLAAWLAAQRPDLVVHTGDVTVDAADQEEDAAHCAGLMAALGIPFIAVPGNHDVGDALNPYQPVNPGRLERWRRHFGDDHWYRDIEGWRLIAFDALLLGSGEPAEKAQHEWLRAVTADAGGRRIGWFLHKPLFLDHPGEPDTGYWSVRPEPRALLFDLLRRHKVAFVASGHLHRWHELTLDGTHYIWGPPTGFLVGLGTLPPMGGSDRLGAVVYDIAGEHVSTRITEVAGLQDFWFDDVKHEVYPPPPGATG